MCIYVCTCIGAENISDIDTARTRNARTKRLRTDVLSLFIV